MAAHVPDRFEVLEEIARSETEVRLRARDRVLLREVVLERPEPAAAGQDPKDLERSLRQARSLARVRHPGVVRLLDVLETPEGPLLVLEPLAGETLAERLRERGPLPPEEVRALGIELCDALAAVHAEGIVHRGLSTASIVLRTDGAACLTGFVFAKPRPGAEGAIPATTFLYEREGGRADDAGLPPHPAPEQIRGEPADARSDVFGLGWVLYAALTGDEPYPRELSVERWTRPADPREAAPGTSRALAGAILRCLKVRPLERFAGADEARAALEAASPAPSARRSRRGPLLAGAALAAAALVLLYLGSESGGSFAGEGARGIPPTSARPGAAYTDHYADSYALLIGIGDYEPSSGFAPLPNAERDVAALEARLEQMPWEKWEVEPLTGPEATRKRIMSALRTLARRTGPNDRVLVYYAGHGERSEVGEQTGWIVPAGAPSAAEDPGRSEWIAFKDLDSFFDEAQAKHVLVALDCCYGGRLTAGARSSAAQAYETKYLTRRAQVVISSGRSDEQVSDGERGGLSPFAEAFLEALGADEPAITTSWLFARIQQRFVDHAQAPSMGCSDKTVGGEVVFFLEPPGANAR